MAKIFKGLKTNIGYYPLDDASAEIRLLELLPSGTTSVEKSPQIQCRLAHVSLDDESEYTALSYVWGQRGSSVPIQVEYLPTSSVVDGDKKRKGWKKLLRRMVPKTPKEHFPSSVLSEIRVTSNLEAALKHIRKESESVMLWVDAICIDQTNNQEKNIQVGRMGSIFEKAMETIVWLGPAADESDLLLEIFEETLPDARLMDMKTKSVATEVARAVGEMAATHDPDKPSKHSVESYDWLVERVLGRIPGKRAFPSQAAAALFRREWWSRVWVLQEFILSRNTHITCGTKRFCFDDFKILLNICFGLVKGYLKRSVSFKNFSPYELSFANTFLLMPLFAWSEIFYYKTHEAILTRSTLIENLYRTTMEISMKATDPRDHIYALLGIAKDDLGIIPEYEKPVGDVYANATMSMLQAGELFPLCVSEGTGWNSIAEAPPSWVVDWPNIPSPRMYHPKAYERCSAGGDTEAKLEPIAKSAEEPWTLCISGVRVGRIAHLGTSVPRLIDCPNNKAAELPGVLGPWLDNHEFATSPGTDKTALPAPDQQRMLDVADAYVEDRNKFSLYRRSGTAAKDAVSNLLETTRPGADIENLTDEAEMFSADLSELLGGRKFFRTAEGKDGVLTLLTRLDDLVVIFYGGRVPFVLREQEDGFYSLIGAAYVEGYMHGEFMKEEILLEEVFRIR